MAKAIKQFVVAIKADTSKYDKGMNDVTSKMSGFRSTALGVGGAIGTALSGLGANAVSVANDMDKLGVAMRFQDLDTQYVYNMGAAIERLGGNSEEALQFITRFQDKFDKFKTLGEGSELYGELKVAGLNAEDFIDAKSIEELINRISNSLVGSSDKTKRMVQDSLGVSTSFIEMLSKGSVEFNKQLKQSEEYHGNIKNLTEQSREFNEQWAIAGQHLAGFKNSLAESVLPSLTEAVKLVGQFFSKENRDEITAQMLDKVDEVKTETKREFENAEIRRETSGWYEGTLEPVVNTFTNPIKNMAHKGAEALDWREKEDTTKPYTTDGAYDPSKMDYSVPMIPNIEAPKPDPSSSNKVEMNAQAQINLNATFETKLDGEVIDRRVENVQATQDLAFLESIQSTTKA